MLVCMLTWEELQVEEMTLNHLHIHLFFFTKAGCRGKDIRYYLFICSLCPLGWGYTSLSAHATLLIALYLLLYKIFRVIINHSWCAKRKWQHLQTIYVASAQPPLKNFLTL